MPAEIPPAGEGIPRGTYARPLGAAISIEPMREDEAYRTLATNSFTSITPENDMKWDALQPEQGEFDFEAADEIVAYARATGKRVRGHTLVWDQQLPDWVTGGDWSKRELTRVLRRHVARVMRHFKGKVEEWDVVNEPLDDAGGWEDSVWHEVIGPRYVDIAFRAARRADPDAGLFLNEIEAERGPKSAALVELARGLARRGVPIDGVGVQNHAALGEAPSEERLLALGEAFAALGLDFAITEMDVALPEGDDVLDGQAAVYRDAARACVRLASCTGLTVWGVKDDWSWLGTESRPLPFDGAGGPKPAFEALRRTLRKTAR